MGFKANIDIALSFSNLKICSVRQQGRIKFRICLYYTCATGQQKSLVEEIQYCHPYSIVRKNNEQKNIMPTIKSQQMFSNYQGKHYNPFIFPIEQSQLDMSSDYYVSKPFKIMFERQYHPILETCCFRTYVDIEKYSDVNLRCQVELLFCPNAVSQQAAIFKTIGNYLTFRPIYLLCSISLKVSQLRECTKQLSQIFDMKNNQISQIPCKIHKTFTSIQDQQLTDVKQCLYLVNRAEVRSFYHYYRQLLQKQLFTIQERHYDLLRVLKINAALQQFRILRVNPNNKVDTMIDHLGGYNSQRNIYSISQKKHSQNHSFESSISTNIEEGPKSNRGIAMKSDSNYYHQHSSQRFRLDISDQIIHDFLAIKAHIYRKWSQFLQFTTKNIDSISEKYRTNYNSLVKQRLSGNVFSHRVNCSDWRKSAYNDSGYEHLRQAQTERKKIQKDEQLWKQAFLVENQGFFAKDSKNIKIFQQIYTVNQKINGSARSQRNLRRSLEKNQAYLGHTNTEQNSKRSLNNLDSLFENGRKNSLPVSLNNFKSFNGLKMMQQQIQGIQLMVSSVTGDNQNYDEDHFIILVHGFQASRQDFIVLKNCLQIRFKTKVFISTSNQGRTDDDIETQGKRLALELQKYLNDSSPSLNYRLSFIGHSMGGIIIRTALCYLQNIQQHLHSYITLSTPHLGYLYEPSTHIQAGLWLMSTLQKTDSIQQLCVRDREDLRQTFLYRLSRSKSLDRFKNIAFVGSCQDKYVPYESARVEHNHQVINSNMNSQSGSVINEMIDGILGTIQCKQLSRMDVIFNIQQSNFDTMIGRTAHIRYLSDRQFIKVFCIVFDKFFK